MNMMINDASDAWIVDTVSKILNAFDLKGEFVYVNDFLTVRKSFRFYFLREMCHLVLYVSIAELKKIFDNIKVNYLLKEHTLYAGFGLKCVVIECKRESARLTDSQTVLVSSITWLTHALRKSRLPEKAGR